MTLAAAEIVVSGYVQGVGFRHFCLVHAGQLRLTGTVRNDRGGSVSIHAEGDRGLIEELITTLRKGPFNATVSEVSVQWTAFTGAFERFEITR